MSPGYSFSILLFLFFHPFFKNKNCCITKWRFQYPSNKTLPLQFCKPATWWRLNHWGTDRLTNCIYKNDLETPGHFNFSFFFFCKLCLFSSSITFCIYIITHTDITYINNIHIYILYIMFIDIYVYVCLYLHTYIYLYMMFLHNWRICKKLIIVVC